jgi:predicted nuclease of predicted toxin-antitoxin system
MKLLLDENISWRIAKYIENYFDEIIHVTSVHNHRLNDLEIWLYAKENNLTILTFDEDFRSFASYFGFPPKVILLKTGNVSKLVLKDKLILNIDSIIEFNKNNEFGILQIN